MKYEAEFAIESIGKMHNLATFLTEKNLRKADAATMKLLYLNLSSLQTELGMDTNDFPDEAGFSNSENRESVIEVAGEALDDIRDYMRGVISKIWNFLVDMAVTIWEWIVRTYRIITRRNNDRANIDRVIATVGNNEVEVELVDEENTAAAGVTAPGEGQDTIRIKNVGLIRKLIRPNEKFTIDTLVKTVTACSNASVQITYYLPEIFRVMRLYKGVLEQCLVLSRSNSTVVAILDKLNEGEELLKGLVNNLSGSLNADTDWDYVNQVIDFKKVSPSTTVLGAMGPFITNQLLVVGTGKDPQFKIFRVYSRNFPIYTVYDGSKKDAIILKKKDLELMKAELKMSTDTFDEAQKVLENAVGELREVRTEILAVYNELTNQLKGHYRNDSDRIITIIDLNMRDFIQLTTHYIATSPNAVGRTLINIKKFIEKLADLDSSSS